VKRCAKLDRFKKQEHQEITAYIQEFIKWLNIKRIG
jgi:hypothetical protein